MAAIFIKPLSTGPWKSVCGLMRFTSTIASASDALRSDLKLMSTFLFAQPNGSHFHQTAFDRTMEICVRLDAVHQHNRISLGRAAVRSETDEHLFVCPTQWQPFSSNRFRPDHGNLCAA